MARPRLLYRLAVGAARTVAPLAGAGGGKVARGLAGRRKAHEVLARWGEEVRDPDSPTVWFHAPSVGESLQAEAVIEALRVRMPDVQIVFTYFSPSAVTVADRMRVDVAGYLPWDLRSTTSRVLDAVRPEALVFTQTEVWPVLVESAVDRGVSVVLAAGTVPADAGRMSLPARALLRTTWESLTAAYAVGEPDAERLRSLGVGASAVSVTGDPGVDSAARRVDDVSAEAAHLRPFHADPRPTLVAGSTWPADMDVLVPALAMLRERVPGVRLVIAPHEPEDAVVSSLLDQLDSDDCSATTLSRVESVGSTGGADAIVVDRVGVLADLYTIATVAFVGGGFHGAGLHSVLEPAAASKPVVFGPSYGRSVPAAQLIEAGAATSVESAEGLAEALIVWCDDAQANHDAATRAQGYIQSHLGAAKRTADALADLLAG
jgi:3-deoxy-D-manno-octulosonic-acid transferase